MIWFITFFATLSLIIYLMYAILASDYALFRYFLPSIPITEIVKIDGNKFAVRKYSILPF